MTASTKRRLLVLWDRDCAFCSRAARYASDHYDVEAVAYQVFDVASVGLTPQLCAEALQVVDRDTGAILAGSDAVAAIMRRGSRTSRLLGRIGGSSIVRPIAQPTYRLVSCISIHPETEPGRPFR